MSPERGIEGSNLPAKMTVLAELLGESPGIAGVRQTLQQLLQRQTDARRLPPILLQGETGTGKGLLARAIHRAGPRRDGPFVDVNCAAIPDTLLEAEMFGFERGAFTDARQAKAGLLQAAHRGTIFLDELGLLPEALQAKLLKALEEQAVRRLGSTRTEPVDVWLLSATSEDLAVAARHGRFREDLYHRLAVLTVRLPPLREREEDILLLAEHFLARACADYQLAPKRLEAGGRAALLAYHWPGNIRELANVMERVALLSEEPVVTAEVLALPEAPAAEPRPAGRGEVEVSLDEAVGTVEREHLLQALQQTNWNISRAAALLGVSRNTLRYRLEKHGLRPGISSAPPRRQVERAPVAEPAAPVARPEVAAPRLVRWERRRLTLLRAELVPPREERLSLDSSRHLEVLVDKVQSFGGRVEELSPTGIVAVFGLEPVEDTARRAALAAMAIQKAVDPERRGAAERFTVKLGIHIGQFMVGRVDGSAEIDFEAKREAGRVLEGLIAGAELDTVLVSPAAAPFLERRFELLPVGVMEQAVGEAYRLVGRERTGFGLRGRVTRFVGRRDELELLRSRLASGIRGHGQVVGIVGEPGIGKSRLLFEFRQSLEGQQVTYLEGHCLSYGSAIPYLPVLDILKASCGITEADTLEAMTEKVHVGLEEVGMEGVEWAPYLLHLLGLKDGTDQLALLSPEVIKTRIFETLRQMSLRRSRKNSLIIVIEDLHWIDKASEEYFAALVEAFVGARILLVSTYRPGYRPPWMEKSYASQIALQPLARQDSLNLLYSLLGEQVADAVVEVILSKAEGNPLFLEELARAVREQGGPSPIPMTVPDTIEEVLLARIDRLPPDAKRLLQSAAVIGKDVPFSLLQAIAELTEEALRPGLMHLQAAEFLYETSHRPETEYTFKHPLTHEVAYRSLLPEEKRALHAKIVQAIERLSEDRLSEQAEVLAHHALQGEVWDKAVKYLREAAARAFGRGAVMEALERYEQALSLIPRLPEGPDKMRQAVDVRLNLHGPLVALGQIRRLTELHSEAERLARALNNPPRLGQVLYRMGQYAWIESRYADAIKYNDEALDIARVTGDGEVRVTATYGSALTRYSLGRYGEAQELFRRVVDGPDAEGARRVLAVTVPAYVAACGWLGQCFSIVGEVERALGYSDRAIQAAEESDHPRSQAIAYTLKVVPLVYAGRVEEAVALSERAVTLCETNALLVWLPGAYAALGWALAWSGRAAEGASHLERGATMVEAMGIRTHLSLIYVWWAEGLVLAGRLEEARQVAERALKAAVANGEQGHEAQAYSVIASVLAAHEPADRDAAAAAYEQARALAEALGMRPLLGRCHLGLGRLYLGSGDRARTAEHLQIAAGLFRELGMRLWLEQAESLLGAAR